MPNPEKLERLTAERFGATWRHTSRYLPLQPALARETATPWQRLNRIVWRALAGHWFHP
jgi:hypothetical protein